MNDYITLGIKEFYTEYFRKPKNLYYINKPSGGLWGCNYDKNIISHWFQWCNFNNFNVDLNIGIRYQINDNAKIYTINSYKDLEYLTLSYPDLKIDFMRNFKYIDFEKVALDYDGIILTENGLLKTKFSTPLSLYSWDVPCILILNKDIICNIKEWNLNDKKE